MGTEGLNGKHNGFTLIELSIVLVIIGLIVGGVLTGRLLIHTSELRSIIIDEQRYITAVNTFRTKYNELPGDMVHATNLWGADPSNCPSGIQTASNTTYTTAQMTTCNGNGNGFIESEETGAAAYAQVTENFRAWQQLANAGLIQGSYTGTAGPLDAYQNLPGLNVPSGKIQNAGFEWAAIDATGRIPASYWNAQYNVQYLLFGTSVNNGVGYDNGGYTLDYAVLNPTDAQAIDLKIDDGLPFSGNVLASAYSGGVGGTCGYGSAGMNSYANNISIIQCSMLFAVKN